MTASNAAPTPMTTRRRRCRRSDSRFCASSSRSASCAARQASTGCAEHVVEDLVADVPALLDRAQDSALREPRAARAGPPPAARSPNSARSATSCAIFVPEGVTRWLKSRAATSFSSSESSAIAPARCSSTTCCAPPRRARVSASEHVRPAARSSSQMRCITSWRYGASIRAAGLAPLDRAEPAERRLDLARADLVEDALGELRLDRDRRAR